MYAKSCQVKKVLQVRKVKQIIIKQLTKPKYNVTVHAQESLRAYIEDITEIWRTCNTLMRDYKVCIRGICHETKNRQRRKNSLRCGQGQSQGSDRHPRRPAFRHGHKNRRPACGREKQGRRGNCAVENEGIETFSFRERV